MSSTLSINYHGIYFKHKSTFFPKILVMLGMSTSSLTKTVSRPSHIELEDCHLPHLPHLPHSTWGGKLYKTKMHRVPRFPPYIHFPGIGDIPILNVKFGNRDILLAGFMLSRKSSEKYICSARGHWERITLVYMLANIYIYIYIMYIMYNIYIYSCINSQSCAFRFNSENA